MIELLRVSKHQPEEVVVVQEKNVDKLLASGKYKRVGDVKEDKKEEKVVSKNKKI